MAPQQLLVSALAAIVVLAILARRLALPYPIVFVLGGSALAFIPGVPAVTIEPDWIFVTVLPPLLFAGGWSTDWTLFRRNLRPIVLLAVGLVFVTTFAVAACVEALVPGFGWASAFVLGAIVAPPDAVAAAAIFERFHVPRRIAAILDGEGLVNDGSALTIYRFAVAAAVTESFSLAQASTAFVVVVVGGIGVGLAVAAIADVAARGLARLEMTDSILDNLVMLVTPYVAYLSGDSLHVSGVLAAVAAGILNGRRSAVIYDPETRLVGSSVWNLMIYLLNALVFLLIGLELKAIVADGNVVARWIGPALAVTGVAIGVRIAWVLLQVYGLRRVWPGLQQRDPPPAFAWIAVLAWTGLRGIVSLAAALALPLQDAAGRPFPQRDAIVFITFCVIVVTLVGQGLTLVPVMRLLRFTETGDGESSEVRVRITALEAGLAALRELEREADTPEAWETLGRAQAEYRNRIEHLRRHGDGDGAESAESRYDHRVQEAAISAERREIMRLRTAGEIPDEIFRKVQYDLDLAETRLK